MKLYIPKNVEEFNSLNIEKFLNNINNEISYNIFNEIEKKEIDNALYKRYRDKKQKDFFEYHFLDLWTKSISYIFKNNNNPTVVELGSGTGTTSILLSLLGANVIGIEYDENLYNISNKRLKLYKDIKNINCKFINADALKVDYSKFESIDTYFSLFAFNLMQPTELLLNKMNDGFKGGNGQILIIDGNNTSIFNKIIPSRWRNTLSPHQICNILLPLGFKNNTIQTNCMIPPFLYKLTSMRKFLRFMEYIFHKTKIHKFFGVSYILNSNK